MNQEQPEIMMLLNLTIFAVCISIVATLLYLERRTHSNLPTWTRVPQIARGWFVVFIAFCGTTHLTDVIVLHWPQFWISVAVHVCTAVTGATTLIVLWNRIPYLLQLPKQVSQILEESSALRRRVEGISSKPI